MRYAEKSFEVRFCAALSAAIMPFNRNPQWFGMTQAQERKTGIDTMIQIGGRLIIFQFKAKQDQKFKLEKAQWQTLDNVSRLYPRSVHYVFPEAATTKEAAAHNCIMKHSWCSTTSAIGASFPRLANSTALSLEPTRAALVKSRPKISIPAKSACQTFGCFCPPHRNAIAIPNSKDDQRLLFFLQAAVSEAWLQKTATASGSAEFGIPMGEQDLPNPDRTSVTSVSQFETMLEDKAEKNLAHGLFGLLIHEFKH